MFALALARRLDGSGVTVNCLHPGVVATNILPHSTNLLVRGATGLGRRFMRTEEEGAQTSLHVALSSELDGVTGKYFDGDRKIRKPSRAARNVAMQERLWELSLKLTDSATQSRPSTPDLR
jgi:NAD(P)-dependent dehydrogenase (short-subunit alcohol dehydrogenase family)